MRLIAANSSVVVTVVVSVVGVLLQSPVAVGASKIAMTRALCQAVERGDKAQIVDLIKQGADVDARNDRGEAALHVAVWKPDPAMVRLLLEQGATVDKRRHSFTPLHDAAGKGQIDIVRVLLEHGASINALADGETPLLYASRRRQPELVKLLLDHGAKPNIKRSIGPRALDEACKRNDVASAKLLIEHGAIPGTDSENLLEIATGNGWTEMAALLREQASSGEARQRGRKAPKRAARPNKTTKLREAIEWYDVDTACELIAQDAPLDKKDRRGNTPLHSAIDRRLFDVVRAVVERGPVVNVANRRGETPLARAIERGGEEIVSLLLESGYPISEKDWPGAPRFQSEAKRWFATTAARSARPGAHARGRTQARRRAFYVGWVGGSRPMATAALVGVLQGGLQQPEEFRGLWGADFRPPRGDSWQKSAFYQVGLRTAATAAALTGKHAPPKDMLRLFQLLLQKDIERVTKTPRLSWDGYLKHLRDQAGTIGNIDDLCNEMAASLVTPVAPQVDTQLARGLVARRLARHHATIDIYRFNRVWHDHNQLPDALVPLAAQGRWHRLFRDPISVGNNFSFVSLDSGRALVGLGKALNQCVGGGAYARACLAGDTHIVALYEGEQPVATVELIKTSPRRGIFRTRDGAGWQLGQFSQVSNRLPSPAMCRALDQFFSHLKDKGRDILTRYHGEVFDSGQRYEQASHNDRAAGFPLAQIVHYSPRIAEHYHTRVAFEHGNAKDASGRRQRTPILSKTAKQVVLRRVDRLAAR